MGQNVSVTYQEMQEAAKQLRNGQAEIQEKLGQLQKLVQSLVNGGFVTDRASKQFDQSYNEFSSGATRTMEGLDGMGLYLERAADAFRQADEQLAQGLQGG
jgi:WXG100 family type VII secretion target